MTDICINIITRTNKRPIFFDMNHKSIEKQTYKNWKHIISYHNDITYNYLKLYNNITTVKVEQLDRKNYNHFPYNLYCNILYQFVTEGLIMFLDDDDILVNDTALETIVNNYKNNYLIVWKSLISNTTIPSNKYFGKKLGLAVSSICFSFHSNYIKYAKWDEFKGSDGRVARNLEKHLKNIIWIPEILTKINYDTNLGIGNCEGGGYSIDKK